MKDEWTVNFQYIIIVQMHYALQERKSSLPTLSDNSWNGFTCEVQQTD